MTRTASSIKPFARLALVLAALVLGSANAQWGMDGWLEELLSFDQQVQAQLGGMMNSSFGQQQGLMAQVGADPAVRAQYQTLIRDFGQVMSYEEFVYYYILTAGGTDLQGGLRALQGTYEGNQRAAGTVAEGYDGYNQGWWQSQATIGRVLDDWSTHAILGNSYYMNPNTGVTYELPYTSGPGYYEVGGESFFMNESGQYFQYVGGYWTPLDLLQNW